MAKLTVKEGVTPPIVRILAGIANVAKSLGVVNAVVITAARNGVHKQGSRHYTDAAIDIRTKNFPDEPSKHQFLDLLRAELGEHDYDFLYEDPGGANQHIHIEYDPHGH